MGDWLFMIDQKALGILFGIAAGAMWAVEAVLGKILLSSLNFLQVTASEAFFTAITAFAYILLSRKPVKIKSQCLKDILLVGFLGTVIAPLAYFFGLTQTSAVNATLLAHLQPLFVSIFGFFFLKERIHRYDVMGGVTIGLAVILITGRTPDNIMNLKLGNMGDLAVLLATLGWAFVAIPGKRLTKQTSSILIVGYRFLVASIFFFPLLLFLNQLMIKSIYQILLGVIVGLGYIFYYEGLKRIKASEVALTELSSPFFAAALAWIILGERMTVMQVIGALLLIIGLIALTRRSSDLIP